MFYSKIILIILNFLDYFQQKKIIKLINKKFFDPIIVFDVGAHYGETIKLFNKELNIKKIYSFEASSKNYKILKKNIFKYDQKKVETLNYGIGNKITKSYINQTIESSSSTINELNINSKYLKKKLKILNIKDKNSFQHKVPIEIITLDYFIEKKKLKM